MFSHFQWQRGILTVSLGSAVLDGTDQTTAGRGSSWIMITLSLFLSLQNKKPEGSFLSQSD